MFVAGRSGVAVSNRLLVWLVLWIATVMTQVSPHPYLQEFNMWLV